MVSTFPAISKSSSPCTNPLVTVPRAAITICIIVTFMFRSFFFYSLTSSRYFSLFSHSFNFTLWSAGIAKSTIFQVLLFVYYKIWSSSRDLVIRFVSRNLKEVYASHSLGKILDCAYISSYGQTSISCSILNGSPCPHSRDSFCANLLHSLIMWLIVSSLSPHNLHLLFYGILSILALIWFVLMAFLCCYSKRFSFFHKVSFS